MKAVGDDLQVQNLDLVRDLLSRALLFVVSGRATVLKPILWRFAELESRGQ